MANTVVTLAINTGYIICELEQIPNQPIMFSDEDFGRSEDAFLAKTWCALLFFF